METYRFAVFHSGAKFILVEARKRLDGSLAVFTILKSSLQHKDATCSPWAGLQSVTCRCWKDRSAQPAGYREKTAEGIAGKGYHAVRLLQLLHILKSIILQVKRCHCWSNVHTSNTKRSAVDKLNNNTNCWVVPCSLWKVCIRELPSGHQAGGGRKKRENMTRESRQTRCNVMTQKKKKHDTFSREMVNPLCGTNLILTFFFFFWGNKHANSLQISLLIFV